MAAAIFFTRHRAQALRPLRRSRGYNPAIAASDPETEPTPGNPPGQENSRLEAALEALVRRGELLASLSDLLLLLAVFTPLLAVTVLQMALLAARTGYGPGLGLLAGFPVETMPWLWLGAGTWCLLSAASSIIWSQRLRSRVRRAIGVSSLPEALAAGLLEASLIVEHTAVPWRLLLPRGQGLAADLWRVAANLDWYLAAPRPLLRAQWLYNLLLMLLAITAIGISFVAPLIAMLLGLLLLLLLLPLCFVQQRRRIWAEELARELRHRLAG